MDDKTFRYEDEIAGRMQEFIVKESAKAFTIEVPGTPYQEAVDGHPPVEAVPTKQWSFPKEALAKVFPHGREDLPALCDFIQASWSFSRIPEAPAQSILKPTEEQVKLMAVCKKFSLSLLTALDVVSYTQFRELNMAVDQSTTTGAIRAAEAQAAKEAKAAERKAARDAKNADKKAERDKAKAEKKAAKDKEREEKKAAKAKEREEKKTAEKARIEAARIESVNKKNAELAANGGQTASQAEKAKTKAKYTGRTKEETAAAKAAAKAEEKAERERLAAEDKARKEELARINAELDAEFDGAGKSDDDAVTNAILNGDDTPQG